MRHSLEHPMPFRDTIPAALHGALWLPWQGVTLTLPYDTWALIGEREGYAMPRATVLDMLVAEGYGIIPPNAGPEATAPVEPPDATAGKEK